MSVVYERHGVTVHHGDCLDVLPTLADASVDAVVTDPPYGLSDVSSARIAETITAWAAGQRDIVPTGRGFMGKQWDAFVPPPALWDECLRVLKPGGHLLSFAGTRMFDLMTLSIRLAGFEIRDTIADLGLGEAPTAGLVWLQGQGFPKSRAALRPAFEPIVVARRPLDGTVAANVAAYGTGVLNIDACRVMREAGDRTEYGRGVTLPHANTTASLGRFSEVSPYEPHSAGRWPTNVVLDGEAADALDEQAAGKRAARPAGAHRRSSTTSIGDGDLYSGGGPVTTRGHGGEGASRFFPVFHWEAKAPAAERPKVNGVAHPTVKPLALMRWLVRLVTPPGGLVLDPFLGSGTTAQAARAENCRCTGIERETAHLDLIRARLDARVQTDAAGAPVAAETLSLLDLLDAPSPERNTQ